MRDEKVALKPYNQEGVRWYNAAQATSLGIVYFHGASSSRLELFPAVEMLAQWLQVNVFFVRAPEHGVEASWALQMQSYWKIDDFYAQIESQIENKNLRFADKMLLMATSQGAGYAYAYAARHSDKVVAMMLVSPLFANREDRSWGIRRLKRGICAFTLKSPWLGFGLVRLLIAMQNKSLRHKAINNMTDANSFYRLGWSDWLTAPLVHVIFQNPPWAYAHAQKQLLHMQCGKSLGFPIWFYYSKSDKLVDVAVTEQLADEHPLATSKAYEGGYLPSNANEHVLMGVFQTSVYDTCKGVVHASEFLSQVLKINSKVLKPLTQAQASALYADIFAGKTVDRDCALWVQNALEKSTEYNPVPPSFDKPEKRPVVIPWRHVGRQFLEKFGLFRRSQENIISTTQVLAP